MFDTSKQRRRINRRIKKRTKGIWSYSLVLLACSAVSFNVLQVMDDKFENVFRQPVAHFIQSDPQYFFKNKQAFAAVKDDKTRVEHLSNPSAYIQKVNYTTSEKMELTKTLPEKEKSPDVTHSSYKEITTQNNEYYVQVSSLKNYKYAENILIKLKKHYPDVNIVEQNNFYKVRITGLPTKKQGAIISKKIEQQLNMKPLLVKKIHNASLDDAVKPFIGTSYSKIDCYGLIVRGLMNQGVKYYGNGGLREKLEHQAELDGLPGNTYFSGEGLVEKAGEKLFSKFLPSISDSRKNAEHVYSEMAPYLQKGFILSFSTPTRGHTGVVSRQGDEWTYINSGIIDNQISPGRVSKRVGEELLQAEIENWFFIASSRKEPLTVTLGRMDMDQLKDFYGLSRKDRITASNIY